jgi:hypothetical protein
MMTAHRWIACVAILMGWVGLGGGTALGAALPPVATNPPGATPITLSVLQGNLDVADSYLPGVTIDPLTRLVTGASVTLRVNGLAGAVITLAASTAWPGTCTNFRAPMVAGQSSDTNAGGQPAPDFTLAGNVLTSLDCGGTATLQVSGGGNTYTFTLPRDGNNNGIPDSFEAAFGTLVPDADPDQDGISSFDEYRGFIVSGRLVRGNPIKKDIFVMLINPQTAGSLTLPAGGSLLGKLPTETRTVYPIDGTALTANMDALEAIARVHILGQKRDAAGNLIYDGLNKNTDEIIDRFAGFSITAGKETFVYRTATNTLITITNLNRKSTPTDDRVVNANRRFGPPQKIIRLIESLDVSKTTPIGSSSWGSPNDLNEAIIYTQRIVNFINTTPPTTETKIFYATSDGTRWGTYANTFTIPGVAGVQTVTRNYITSKMMQFVFAHEAGGHDTKLTVTATSLGFHDPTGTGGMLDSQVQIITTGDPLGIKFRIPSRYLSGHLSGIQVGPVGAVPQQ